MDDYEKVLTCVIAMFILAMIGLSMFGTYVEMEAFNRISNNQVTYKEALFSDLTIIAQ